jgi:hypothetical protein
MGRATEIATAVTRTPLSTPELDQRRDDVHIREKAIATLGGAVVEPPQPASSPVQVRAAEPVTWD